MNFSKRLIDTYDLANAHWRICWRIRQIKGKGYLALVSKIPTICYRAWKRAGRMVK